MLPRGFRQWREDLGSQVAGGKGHLNGLTWLPGSSRSHGNTWAAITSHLNSQSFLIWAVCWPLPWWGWQAAQGRKDLLFTQPASADWVLLQLQEHLESQGKPFKRPILPSAGCRQPKEGSICHLDGLSRLPRCSCGHGDTLRAKASHLKG